MPSIAVLAPVDLMGAVAGSVSTLGGDSFSTAKGKLLSFCKCTRAVAL